MNGSLAQLATPLLAFLLLSAATSQAEPLTLKQCLTEVLAKNPEMNVAHADREEKTAALSVARKDLLPSLSADYTYRRQTEDLTALSRVPENYYNYGVTVSQPIFRGGALINTVKIGELNLERAQVGTIRTRNDLILATHRAYCSLLKQQKLAEESRQAVTRLGKHLTDAKKLLRSRPHSQERRAHQRTGAGPGTAEPHPCRKSGPNGGHLIEHPDATTGS